MNEDVYTKVCLKCNKTLPLTNFSKKKCAKDGFQPSCKECYSKYYSELTKARLANGCCAKCGEVNYNNNRLCDSCKIPQNISVKKYGLKESSLAKARDRGDKRRKTPKYRLRTNEYQRFKYATDVNYKLGSLLRSRLRDALRHNNKGGVAIRDLGCSIIEFRKYIEDQFTPGMTWENRGCGKGQWSIDHIISVESIDLTDKEQYSKICHYTNLRPMWQSDNIKKSRIERLQRGQLQ
jgi:hypothetical protein